MLTSDQLDALVDPVLELYADYQDSVIRDIARRLAGMDYARPTAAWQMQRLSESGKVYENILEKLAKLTGRSESELKAMFEKAGVKAMRFDDAVYRAAGLEPLPLNLSPAMAQVLAAGLRKTQGVVKNLTMTTALDGQNAFLEAADLAYMQVSSGAMSYSEAIVAGVKKVASDGLSVIQFPGRRDQLDVAMRRTLLTGVNQTVGNLQIARADEMGQDLVAVSAHVGARNTGVGPANHESWQGKIYSRSGTHKKYKPFVETTGYGTGPGLCGWNCRHSFYPFFEGISENAYSRAELESYADKTVKYNGEMLSFYDATQKQRAIERKIRYWKRQEGALKAAGLDSTRETAKVRQWQAEMRSFTKQTGLIRQGERERVANFAKGSVGQELKPSTKAPIIKPGIPVEEPTNANLGKIDFASEQAEIIGKTADLRNYFPAGTPGREFIVSRDVELSPKRKAHIRTTHKEQIPWLENNIEAIQQALIMPDFIDAVPFRDKGRWAITHVSRIDHETFDVLVIGVRYGKTIDQNHDTLTIFLADKLFIFDKTGVLKPRWQKLK